MSAYKVTGMTCNGCASSVTRAITTLAPEAEVRVDLATGTVTVDGPAGEDIVRRAVEDAGFDFEGKVP